jgi:hypothetical protein
MAMNYFVEWLEYYTIPSHEALTVAEALVTNFFCHSGGSNMVIWAITFSLI